MSTFRVPLSNRFFYKKKVEPEKTFVEPLIGMDWCLE